MAVPIEVAQAQSLCDLPPREKARMIVSSLIEGARLSRDLSPEDVEGAFAVIAGDGIMERTVCALHELAPRWDAVPEGSMTALRIETTKTLSSLLLAARYDDLGSIDPKKVAVAIVAILHRKGYVDRFTLRWTARHALIRASVN